MNDAIKMMLKKYGPFRSKKMEQNALAEILQQIVLLGLYRGGFFDYAAFYGGTALRILYGLDRFSEDMDFCLLEPDKHFCLKPYFTYIEDEFGRFGFKATISEKKTGPENVIESAFVKQFTYQGLITLQQDTSGVHKDQIIKIRLEVDKLNPSGATDCKKLVKLPMPIMVRTLTEESLFAGKLHAILARTYLNRVKGRDYYDLMFFLARDISINMIYLEAKLRDSGHYNEKQNITLDALVKMLENKFSTVDFKKARQDVLPFLKDNAMFSPDDWSVELFVALINELR